MKSEKKNHEYLITIPNHGNYYRLLMEYLSNRKFQIQKMQLIDVGTKEDVQTRMIIQCSLYFPPEQLCYHIHTYISDQERKEFGDVLFKEKPPRYKSKVRGRPSKIKEPTIAQA